MLNNPTGDLFMKQRTTEEKGFVAFDDGLWQQSLDETNKSSSIPNSIVPIQSWNAAMVNEHNIFLFQKISLSKIH